MTALNNLYSKKNKAPADRGNNKIQTGLFSSKVWQGSRAGGSMLPELHDQVKKTVLVVVVSVLMLFGSLMLRLWFLQLVKGHELRARSEYNRIRTRDLPPWRGMIIDRHGEILVNNRPAYDLMIVLEIGRAHV